MKTRTQFQEDYSDHQQSQSKKQKIGQLKQLLRECRDLITELQQSNLALEAQLVQKRLIIDKLIEEKQQHILHLSSCSYNKFSVDLQKTITQMQDKEVQYIKSIEQYLAIAKKDREEIFKLKGYNKVLRMENTRLREQIAQGKINANKRGKIGSISSSKKGTEYMGIPTFGSNYKDRLLDQINFNNLQALTPLKSFKSTMSTAFAFTNNMGPSKWNRSTELGQQKPINLSSNLNNLQLLRTPFQNPESNTEQFKTIPNQIQQKVGRVQTWIKRLKDILADTSEQEQQVSQ